MLIHAVVQNDSAAKFPGQVVIKDGEGKVGSVAVTLSPNEVLAVSVSWKPSAGSHTVTAQLEDSAGAVVQSESADFSIKAKPKPVVAKPAASSSEAAAVESSQDIQDKIGSLSPAAEGAVAPVFKVIDGGRESIAEVLDGQLLATKPKLTPTPGVVAGANTIKAPEEKSWFWSILYTIYFYILTVLRFIVGSAGVFYPVVAVLFFLILWKTFKRFRRA